MSVNDIEIYRSDDGSVRLEVNVRGDTVWLSRDQMAELFGRNKSTISRHVRNVFDEGELNHDESVVAKIATTAADGKTYMVDYYNLDVVISVGYRVKSQRGVQFRRWATGVLRRYLMEGYAVNERRLNQLEKVIKVLARSDDRLASGIADVVSSYLPGLNMLRDYDAHDLAPNPRARPVRELSAEDVRGMAIRLRKEYPDDTLLGQERGDALERIIGAVYQSFAGQDLYPTVEEKAAHLLYFMVKDHPFADGNKRIAAATFVGFLEENAAAFGGDGGPVVTNNDLAAITLLIAVSDPGEKELMIDLVERMLTVRENDDEQNR